jgi:hypothetical protein
MLLSGRVLEDIWTKRMMNMVSAKSRRRTMVPLHLVDTGLCQDDEDGEGKVKKKGESVGALAKVRHASASVSQTSRGCARCFLLV